MNSELAAISDEVLVVRIARWDQEALTEIYHRHSGPVCALPCRVLNDRQLVDDVAQEVFLRLWDEPDKFDVRRGTLREAARLLHEPEGTVKSRIRAGLRRLGDALPSSLDPSVSEKT